MCKEMQHDKMQIACVQTSPNENEMGDVCTQATQSRAFPLLEML